MARTFLSDKGSEFINWDVETYTNNWDAETHISSDLYICNGDDVLYFGSSQIPAIKQLVVQLQHFLKEHETVSKKIQKKSPARMKASK